MEQIVVLNARRVVEDYRAGTDLYEGLLYMMFWRTGEEVHPLYIGKAEKFGRKGKKLSANLEGVETNRSFFCRWGDNYAYHIGDLSAVVCGHQGGQTRKYQRWAQLLFRQFPSVRPQLIRPVYFWMTAWRRGDVGPWVEFGDTPLSFAEYLLIGLASSLGGNLLNDEGVNRRRQSFEAEL